MSRISLRPLLSAVLCTALAALSAAAQPLSVTMKDVDFRGLPRVTLSACVQKNNALVAGLDSTQFTLTENGIPRKLRIRCPDPTRFNSVALVIDNSGSISNALVKIREAAGIMVDSLGAADECAVITFGRSITVQQDFTTDRALLAAALTRLTANGGTPMFDASYLGVQMLAARPGNRSAVILTDGEDNMSTSTIADVIALAQAYEIKLYTIGFGIALDIQKIMTRMAVETGGTPFFVERPSELNAVYERIAREITEECCVAEYDSPSCVDTLRDLVLTVTQMLRKKGVVDKFVEFSGSGLASLSLPDRATIANMAPEYGATCGFFPVDEVTVEYLRLTGRSAERIALVEAYCKENALWHDPTHEPEYSRVVELDLADVEPSLAGPRRKIKGAGFTWIHVVPSVKGALRCKKAGVDVIVASGHEGGFHTSWEPVHSMILLPAVVEAVSDENTLVCGAGGFCDGKTLAAALVLGADGAQMGTRFLATQESDFHQI